MTRPAPAAKHGQGGQGGEAGQPTPSEAGQGAAKPAKAVKAAPAKAATKAKSSYGGSETPSDEEDIGGSAGGGRPKGKRGGDGDEGAGQGGPGRRPRQGRRPRNFPAKTLDKLRRLLEEERETYVRQAHDLAAEAEALAAEREPGDTQFDEESGEGDTLNVERERDLALSASANQAVEEIDRALRRMDIGTFGICERCGKKIAVARLEALPFAALCIECKSREERRR